MAERRKLLAGTLCLVGLLLALAWVRPASADGPWCPLGYWVAGGYGGQDMTVVLDRWVVYQRGGPAGSFDAELAVVRWGPAFLLTLSAAGTGGAFGWVIGGLRSLDNADAGPVA